MSTEKKITEEIVEQLVPYQAAIISGLAYGIDITAHKAALKHDLPTFGVMANGLDLVYPVAHQKTALLMQEKGGLFRSKPWVRNQIAAFFWTVTASLPDFRT
nr:DNA-processing protein DprA [Siphonobacter curvatus]